MAKGWKDVENRPWSLSRYFKPEELPARILLHASQTKPTRKELDLIRSKLTAKQSPVFEAVDWSKYRGSIIGEITLEGEYGVDVMRAIPAHWYLGSKHVFAVKDGKLYDKPFPYRGRLGLFEVKMEDEKQAPEGRAGGYHLNRIRPTTDAPAKLED